MNIRCYKFAFFLYTLYIALHVHWSILSQICIINLGIISPKSIEIRHKVLYLRRVLQNEQQILAPVNHPASRD